MAKDHWKTLIGEHRNMYNEIIDYYRNPIYISTIQGFPLRIRFDKRAETFR